MKRLILSAVAALSIAGFTLPALADASSIDPSPSWSAAEFFAEQGNRAPQPAYEVKVKGLSENAVELMRPAQIHKSATPATPQSLTHDDAEYDW